MKKFIVATEGLQKKIEADSIYGALAETPSGWELYQLVAPTWWGRLWNSLMLIWGALVWFSKKKKKADSSWTRVRIPPLPKPTKQDMMNPYWDFPLTF